MKAPRIPSIIRNVRKEPKQFAYKAKHYDKKKEEWEERKERLQREVSMEKGEGQRSTPRRLNFRGDSSHREVRLKARKTSFIRLFVILVILVAIVVMAIERLEKLVN